MIRTISTHSFSCSRLRRIYTLDALRVTDFVKELIVLGLDLYLGSGGIECCHDGFKLSDLAAAFDISIANSCPHDLNYNILLSLYHYHFLRTINYSFYYYWPPFTTGG